MPIRLSGMNSGLDTESIIAELVKAKSVKRDKLKKTQTKLNWKQEAWKELNAKVYGLYSKTLSNMRFSSDYYKKTTKVSNEKAATVVTGGNAVNGVQTLKIDQLAKSGYLTGAKLEGIKGDTKLTNIKLAGGGKIEAGTQISLSTGDSSTTITIDENMTVSSFASQLQKAGVNASFDEKNQRFFISAKSSGEANDFRLTAIDAKGQEALQALGLAADPAQDVNTKAYYEKYAKLYDEAKAEAGADATDEQIAEKIKEKLIASGSLSDAVDQRVKGYEEALKAKDQEIDNLEDKITELENKYGSDTDKLKKDPEYIKTKEKLDAANADRTELTNKYFETNGEGKQVVKRDAVEAEVAAEEVDKVVFAKDFLDGKYVSKGANRIAGQDAKILLNNVEFVSNNNTFEINGLTITANMVTEDEITLTTDNDTDGIYDMIKGFIKEYNEIINQMDKLYNADSSKGYEPLTDEEKDAMSEEEIKRWETKIKDSVLRKDSTLGNVISALKNIMQSGVEMSNGKKAYLSQFGIETLGYFDAADNEKGAYHIAGDSDDAATSSDPDKLKAAIASDPEQVVEFFSNLSRNLYSKLGEMMRSTEYSSAFTLYDDKAMKEEYLGYNEKISQQEKLITEYEDRYYKKFTAMETALAKLQSKESAISGLFSS